MQNYKIIKLLLALSLFSCSLPSLQKSELESLSFLRFLDNQQNYTISFEVSGLLGSGLEIENNSESISVDENGTFTFANSYSKSTSYNVIVKTQPTSPPQNCTVEGGTGTIINGNVTSIQVVCGEGLLSISGIVNNLLGSGLEISNTTAGVTETVSITSTSFAFPPIPQNSSYQLAIVSQPTNPWQTCSITTPVSTTGTLTNADLSMVIDCVTDINPLSVQVVGIGALGTLGVGNELQIQVNGSEIIQFTGDTTLSFPTSLVSGSAYSLSILNAGGVITTGSCSIPSPNGTIAGPTNTVIVNCTAGYLAVGTVSIPGGTPSSIVGSGLVLSLTNTGGTAFATQNLNINAGDTTFSFPAAIPPGAQFQVTITTQPSSPIQACNVTGTGTGAPIFVSGNVNDLLISCALPLPELITVAGTFNNLVNVALNAPVTGANFRYTLGDGTGAQTDPTCASPDTTTTTIPITEAINHTIKVRQCRAGWPPSAVVASGSYNLKVADPSPVVATATGMDAGGTTGFTTTTTAITWFCQNSADSPTAPVDPVCGATPNVCTTGSNANFTHAGIDNKLVKVRACRENFTQSDIVNLSYPVNTYTIGGTISTLTTPFTLNSFVVQNNAADNTILSANGGYTFATAVASGVGYAVTILSSPTSPWQTCVLSNDTGTVSNANVTNVNISCSVNQYNLSGSISGPNAGNLLPGSSITIDPGAAVGAPFVLNSGDPIPTFNVNSGVALDYTITAQPQGQHCIFVNPTTVSGTVGGADITTLDINCVEGYHIGGSRIQKNPSLKFDYSVYQGEIADGPGSPVPGTAIGAIGVSRFNTPRGITFDGTYFYVMDRLNNRIVRINPADGFTNVFAGSLTNVGGWVDDVGTAARFNEPTGAVTDGTYIYNADHLGGHRIRRTRISSANVITLAGDTSSGFADGVGAIARFNSPYGLALQDHYLYIADRDNHRIRRLNLRSNEVTTFAGSGTAGTLDAIGTAANLNTPYDITIIGNYMYVACNAGNNIRRIDMTTQAVTTVAGDIAESAGHIDANGTAARLRGPHGLVTDGFDLYFVEFNTSHLVRRLEISSGNVTTIVGTPTLSGASNGVGANARMDQPAMIGTDGRALYVSSNHSIRKISNNKLKHRFPFAGNTIDYDSQTPNPPDAVWDGTPSYFNGRFGGANGSAFFDGTNRITASANITPAVENISVSLWVRWDGNTGPDANNLFFYLGSSTVADGFGLAMEGTGAGTDANKLRLIAGGVGIRTLGYRMVPNLWTHLTIKKTVSATKFKIYANGKLIGTEDILPNNITTTNLMIGGNLSNANYFRGAIADLRIYQRSINEGEVAELSRDASPGGVGTPYNSLGSPGLVAHYDLDTAGIVDSGPNSYVISNTIGTPGFSFGKDGMVNGGRRTRAGSYNSPNNPHGLPYGKSPRTICVWVKPEQLPTSDGQALPAFLYGFNNMNNSFGIGMSRIAGIQQVGILTGVNDYTVNYSLPLHVWTHLCGTYDGTNVTIFADGRQIGATLPAAALNTANGGVGSLHLGSWFGSDYYPGKIDDARLYNRVLTVNQIRNLASQIPEGLVARYDLQGDPNDSSGFNYHLTPFNGPTLSQDRMGNPNSAYTFNGTNQFMQNVNTNLPLPQGQDARSMCVWTRINQALATPTLKIAAAYGTSATGNAFILGASNLTATPIMRGCVFGAVCNPNVPNPLYTWYHICQTVNPTASPTAVKQYFNGKQVGAEDSTSYITSNSPLTIGAFNNNYEFPGQIDEVTIYNRELSADEVRALSGYNPIQVSTWSGTPAASSLKAYFQADSLSYLANNDLVTDWLDNSGVGNNISQGTAANQPSFVASGIGGKPTIRFVKANNHWLENAAATGVVGNSFTMFGVFAKELANSGGQIVFSIGSTCGNDKAFGYDWNVTNDFFLATYCGFAHSPTTRIAAINEPVIFAHSHADSINRSIFINGLQEYIDVAPMHTYSGNSYMSIGRRNQSGGSEYFGGIASEIIYFDGALSAINRNIIECYLSSKYGIPLDAGLNCD
ncbi:LamG-like jellyroll fold domain-containing protein [Leptospira sp. GIMC2001]|uniref:LamG-like jellyroll fold domain-containing protein n=1 Tax=Leptospira sp. GIMC2001 TaxID=1513297 RepID=UPI00234AD99E|nr:LamG-like jellyroll fold domain-containing protein [Leptospira sp. GIMC2001]WCL49858.1 hypothetical protein O4O04_03295 [Leptospira sp. GIMC2001]